MIKSYWLSLNAWRIEDLSLKWLVILSKSWLIIRHWNTSKQFKSCFFDNVVILIWFQTLTFILNITLGKQMLKLTYLLKCQTAFLVMKMKKFKDVIRCFYHQNSFKLLPWEGGKAHNRASLINAISMNRSKRWTKLTGSWSRSRRGVWNNWRNDVILSQGEQWFKTQSFIKIIISEFLKIWLLNSFNSLMMSPLVIIRGKIKQRAKLSLTITGLIYIMMLIVTPSTAWHANMLRLLDRGPQTCCTLLKSLKNTGKTFSATSSQACLSQKAWMWFLLLLIGSQRNSIISPAIQKTNEQYQRKLPDCSFVKCFIIIVYLSL